MRRLSLISLVMLAIVIAAFQPRESPHGEDFDLGCDLCHGTENWDFVKERGFDHNTTTYPLEGQHISVTCRTCHESLVFSDAEDQCVSCHTDMHGQSLGMECNRCHTPQSWIVNNIIEIHQQSRFPLTGPHMAAQCIDCHVSASLLYFEPLGVECVDCHIDDYNAASSPNHNEAGFSTDCSECHFINSFSWSGAGINHSFFPLTKGHDITDCTMCHTSGDYSNISSDCFSCHEQDYNSTTNPSHDLSGISTNCNECHTTDPGWSPATFSEHDGLFFPVYTGEHAGTWTSCMECHPNSSDYGVFTCISCHEHNQADMDDEHDDVSGYIYENSACLSCHPTGSAEEGFDHNQSAFPLTGEHITTDCADCHNSGFAGTPTECFACHEDDYNNASNPSHTIGGFSTDCAQCHSTDPDWKPAIFNEHDGLYFPVYSGEHAGTWAECAECHQNPTNYAVYTCISCHEHNQVDMDEEHQGINGYVYENSACLACHPDGSATGGFDHSQTIFPLTGAHLTASCADCHTSGYTGTPTECFACHEEDYQGSQNPGHVNLGLSTTCDDCHSTQPDWNPATFAIHNDYYVLVGAHSLIANDCALCHNGNYINTPNTCFGCHQDDYNQTSDPNHAIAQFPTDCELCHDQNAWEPSTFDHDGLYFPIYSGSHNGEWGTCSDCHVNSTNYSVFSCIDCHEHNQTEMDDKHSDVSGYVYNSIACLDCHPDGEAAKFMRIRKDKSIKGVRR